MSQLKNINEAIDLWLVHNKQPWPTRNDEAIVKEYGQADANEVLKILKALEDEFYKSDAWLKANDLAEMGRIAKDDFRLNHPEITEDSLNAFARCYTYDYK